MYTIDYTSHVSGGFGYRMDVFNKTFVEKQIWRNCGKLTHWKITDWKIPKTRYNGVVREPTEGMEKCFGKLQTGQALKAARRF